MMFLLRIAFWLTIVLVLLPSGKSEPLGGPQVAAADAISAATATLSDLGQFCARQVDACTVGSQAAAVLGHRAQTGVKMVYDFFTDRKAATPVETGGGRAPASAHSVVVQSSQDSLIAADLIAPWRDPSVRRDMQARAAN
jgi:hypothetical protein